MVELGNQQSAEVPPSSPRAQAGPLWVFSFRGLVVLGVVVGMGLLGFGVARWAGRPREVVSGPDGSQVAGSQPGQQSSPPAPDPPVPETASDIKHEVHQAAEQLAQRYPDSPAALAVLARVQRLSGKTAEADRTWRRVVELDPAWFDAYLEMAQAAQRRGDFAEAAALAQKALQYDPYHLEARNLWANALLSQQDAPKAIAVLEGHLIKVRAAAGSFFLLGQAYLQQKEYAKARDALATAVELDPEHAQAHYALATACDRLGRTDEAARYRETCKKLQAQQRATEAEALRVEDVVYVRRAAASIYTAAGHIYSDHGEPSQAESCWRRAASLDAADPVSRQALANLCQLAGRLDDALRWTQQLREIQPNCLEHCWVAGLLRLRLGRFDEAEADFRSLIAAAPERAGPYAMLAQLLVGTHRDPVQARELAQKAVQLEPSAENYLVLSVACAENQDMANALAAAQQGLRIEPRHPRLLKMYDMLRAKK